VSVGGGSGLAKRHRRLGKKKEGLFGFGQKTKGMTERGMREVMAGLMWQLLWPSKKGSFGWFWERKSKAKGSGDLLFYLVEIGKSLGLFVCLSFKIFG